MTLWAWALSAYQKPGVPEACLRLQDAYGQNTSFLLWAHWAGRPDAPALAQGAYLARAWDAIALHQIRQVRRQLKTAIVHIDDAARESLRNEIKAAELQAERVLMESLERLGPQGRAALDPSALETAVAVWGLPVPHDAIAALASALD